MKDDSNFPRLTVGGYICPECRKAFQEEPKLWQHAKDSHRETFEFRGSIGEAVARKHFREEANVGPTESEVSKPPINMYLAAVSDDYKCQYLGQKIHGSQRPTARYFCPLCREAFQQESKLWQHALNVHPEYLESLMGDTEPTGEAEAEARKQLCREATPMYLSRHKAIP
jgi:hypothetical protein